MQLPALFHGRYRDVKPRIKRVLKRFARGEDWIALVEERGFLDLASTPGHIVGNGPNSMIGRQEHFQMWFLWALARTTWLHERRELLDRMFRESLDRPWTVLGLVMYHNHAWLHESRQRPFLAAVAPHWDDFAAIGPRYTWGSPTGDELWNIPTSVGYALANQDIPLDVVRAPLVPGAFAALLSEHGIKPRPPAG